MRPLADWAGPLVSGHRRRWAVTRFAGAVCTGVRVPPSRCERGVSAVSGERAAGAVGQPLLPVCAIPWMNCRCRNTKTAITGSEAIREPAMRTG